MLIETWPIDKPRDYPKNARKWSARAIDKVASSIKAYGWRQPIVVDKDGVIVIGHLRRAAGKSLFLKEVPVHVASDLTPAQIRGLRLADNRTNEESTWDLELLGPEMAELKAEGFDLTLTGFETREIDGLLLQGNPLEDQVPDVPEKPVSRLGDLWLCGPHRVLCGDATSTSDVTILLAGVPQPFLMVTDPPYGVEYDPTWRDGIPWGDDIKGKPVVQRAKVVNDDRVDWTPAWELFTGDVAYVWHASLKLEVLASLRGSGLEPRAQIIWRKQQPLFGRGAYHWQHESCWYLVRKGRPSHWIGDHKQSTVWDVSNLNPTGNRNEKRVGLAAQKPVELMRRPILNHTKPGQSAYDPFLGSGSTLIAAEVSERYCYGMELEPAYVDVIVQRWQNLTGKQATLQATGQTFATLKAERLNVKKRSKTNG